MTDIIKFHPEVNSTAVLRYFNKNPQELKSHFDHFKQEITDLGTTENTQVIALGVLAYKLLLKAKLSNKLFKLTHYSSPTLSKLAYQQEVSSLLEKLEA
jgi:hypothetical protein